MKKQTNKFLKLSFALFILFNISYTYPMKKLLSWLNPSALLEEFKLKKDFTSLGKLITYSKQNEAKSIIQKFTDVQKESLLFEVCEKDPSTYQASHGVTAVKMLLECDTNINCINNHDTTPLIIACKKNDTKVAMALIQNGADVNAKNNGNNIPLIWACYRNNIRVAIVLIRNGADVNAKDNLDNTPLIYACYKNNTKVAMVLIQNGADVNAKNNLDNTPLIFACDNNNTEVAIALIQNGALVEENKRQYNLLDKTKKHRKLKK